MTISILIINILIFIALAFLIYKLVKEEWARTKVLEEKIEGLVHAMETQESLNENVKLYQENQIEINKLTSTTFDRAFNTIAKLNEVVKSNREKLDQLDDILAHYMMDEMNEKVQERDTDIPKETL